MLERTAREKLGHEIPQDACERADIEGFSNDDVDDIRGERGSMFIEVSGHHDEEGTCAGARQCREDGKTVELRHPKVENDDAVGVEREHLEGGAPIRSDITLDALVL